MSGPIIPAAGETVAQAQARASSLTQGRPPVVAGPGLEGAGEHTIGRAESMPCIDGRLKQGDMPDGVKPAAAPQSGADSIKAIAQGGGGLLGQMPVKPVIAQPTRAGDAALTSSSTPSGKSGSLPAAGEGPGTGRPSARPGATTSKTLSRPRTSGGGFLPSK